MILRWYFWFCKSAQGIKVSHTYTHFESIFNTFLIRWDFTHSRLVLFLWQNYYANHTGNKMFYHEYMNWWTAILLALSGWLAGWRTEKSFFYFYIQFVIWLNCIFFIMLADLFFDFVFFLVNVRLLAKCFWDSIFTLSRFFHSISITKWCVFWVR